MDADWDEVSWQASGGPRNQEASPSTALWLCGTEYLYIMADGTMALIARPHTLPAAGPPCHVNAGLDNDLRHFTGAPVDGKRICMIP